MRSIVGIVHRSAAVAVLAFQLSCDGGDSSGPAGPCTVQTPHPFGTTTNGALTTSDCLRENTYQDFYTVTVPAASMYQFTQTASFDTFLVLYGADGFKVASLNSPIMILLPAGSFILGPTSNAPLVTGSYTLSSAAAASAITGCQAFFAARGITTTQALQTTDCVINGFYADDMLIFLRTGQVVTIDMTSTAVDAFLEIRQLGARQGVLAFNDDRDASTDNARLVFTAPFDDYYGLRPTSAAAGQTGAYTLTISP
jgi:hypothetical protein